jgi:6-pyruvoyltetrahydropterin/6-carboxytetrahydropterin synthase
MYRLCLQRDFMARHFLVGGDWGGENLPHAHAYRIEWELRAQGLDRHGFLCDLVEVERRLEDTLQRYRGALLNDLPEFGGGNPSLERFARLLWERLAPVAGVSSAVRLWENDSAWASYEDTVPVGG